MLQYVKNMQSLTLDPVENLWGGRLKKDIDALRQETLQIKQDINAVPNLPCGSGRVLVSRPIDGLL